MKENVGSLERIGRSIAGPLLMIMGYRLLRSGRKRPLGVAALVGGTGLLESAITRVCPLNAALGVDTRAPDLARKDLVNEVRPKRLSRLAGRLL